MVNDSESGYFRSKIEICEGQNLSTQVTFTMARPISPLQSKFCKRVENTRERTFYFSPSNLKKKYEGTVRMHVHTEVRTVRHDRKFQGFIIFFFEKNTHASSSDMRVILRYTGHQGFKHQAVSHQNGWWLVAHG